MSSYLKITVVEAKNIASNKKVYASVTVLNSNGQKVGKEAKTPTIKGTHNPAWGSSFVFTVDDEFAGMSVRLYEKPILPVADRFIGVVTIRLMNERIKYKKFDKWYQLAKLTQHQNVSGELRLDIDFRDPDLGDVKKRKKMSDRSMSISGDVSPPEAKLPVDILTRGNTNPRAASPSAADRGTRSAPSSSSKSHGQASASASPAKVQVSPVFARKTSFERRGGSSINEGRKNRASIAVSKFQLDSYINAAAEEEITPTTTEEEKTDTDTDNEIRPMKIGAFSVAQRGGQRRGRRGSEEVDDGYATTSGISPRVRSPTPLVAESKRSRNSAAHGSSPVPAGDGDGTSSRSRKIKRVSTLDVDVPLPKPTKEKSKPPKAPSSDSKVLPTSKRTKTSEATAGYSTDNAVATKRVVKKHKITDGVSPKSTPFSDVEDSPSSKSRKRRHQEDEPEFHAPISVPSIVPIKNASPTKPRTPVRTPAESPVGSRSGSPNKKPFGDSPLGPLVVERHRGSDRSKRLSMQLGYATDAPPSRPRGSSGEKKKSRKSSRESDALVDTVTVSAPVLPSIESPRKKKKVFTKAESPRVSEPPLIDAVPQVASESTVPEPATVPVANPIENIPDIESTSPPASAEVVISDVSSIEQSALAEPAANPEPADVSEVQSEVEPALVAVDTLSVALTAGVSTLTESPIEPTAQDAAVMDGVHETSPPSSPEPVQVPSDAVEQKIPEPSTESPTVTQPVSLPLEIPSSYVSDDSSRPQSPIESPSTFSGVESGSSSPKIHDIPVRTGSISTPDQLSPSSSSPALQSAGPGRVGRSKIDRTSSIVENAVARDQTLARQTSIKDVLSADDPLAKSQMMKNFFSGLGVTKKK